MPILTFLSFSTTQTSFLSNPLTFSSSPYLSLSLFSIPMAQSIFLFLKLSLPQDQLISTFLCHINCIHVMNLCVFFFFLFLNKALTLFLFYCTPSSSTNSVRYFLPLFKFTTISKFMTRFYISYTLQKKILE